jgi:L-lactate utilization protein LutC
MTDTESLFKNDPQLADVAKVRAKFNRSVGADELAAVVKAVEANGHNAVVAENKADALAKIVALIPGGKSVNTAGSTTLAEVGFTDALKANAPGWLNLKEAIVAETDAAKQAQLRLQANSADFHLTSVHAVDHAGVLYAVDATATRTGPLLFGPSHVIVVVGTNKIVADKAAAQERLLDYTLPLESARARVAYAAYGVKGSAANFTAEVHKASPFSPTKRFTVIFVKDTLGF